DREDDLDVPRRPLALGQRRGGPRRVAFADEGGEIEPRPHGRGHLEGEGADPDAIAHERRHEKRPPSGLLREVDRLRRPSLGGERHAAEDRGRLAPAERLLARGVGASTRPRSAPAAVPAAELPARATAEAEDLVLGLLLPRHVPVAEDALERERL